MTSDILAILAFVAVSIVAGFTIGLHFRGNPAKDPQDVKLKTLSNEAIGETR